MAKRRKNGNPSCFYHWEVEDVLTETNKPTLTETDVRKLRRLVKDLDAVDNMIHEYLVTIELRLRRRPVKLRRKHVELVPVELQEEPVHV